MFRDVDQKLLLQELLQDVLGSHIHQGLRRKKQVRPQHCSGTTPPVLGPANCERGITVLVLARVQIPVQRANSTPGISVSPTSPLTTHSLPFVLQPEPAVLFKHLKNLC